MSPNNNEPTRLFIYPKDVQSLKGCGYEAAARVIRTIKDSIGRDLSKSLTIYEYCEHEGVDADTVIAFINNRDKKPKRVV